MEVLPVLMQNTGPELEDPNYDPNAVMDKSPMRLKLSPFIRHPFGLHEFDVSEVFKTQRKKWNSSSVHARAGHPDHIDMDKGDSALFGNIWGDRNGESF
jgi:hypothetical protein